MIRSFIEEAAALVSITLFLGTAFILLAILRGAI
jgi:hypothetical protein